MAETIVNIEDLLRSINIIYDADKPERIGHFQPTSKSLALIRSLLGFSAERAYFISAPYGTGKSISHVYLIQIIENLNLSKEVLSVLAERVNELDTELGSYLQKRVVSKEQGLVIALQGYVENLPHAIEEALKASFKRRGLDLFSVEFKERLDFTTLRKAINSIQHLVQKREDYGIDRILLVWDEFGRHLETLISQGSPAELNQLQTLAEYFSRSKEIPLTLSLLLHQSLMNYAGKVPQSVRKEWRKIEGRFETLQYVDDSKEIYQLIASVISQIRNEETSMDSLDTSHYEENIQKIGLFKDFDKDLLNSTIKKAYPLDPVALYMLPRISSRIAQHERTLFTFLNNLDPHKISGLPELYNYFSGVMSTDTSLGGTYHQWLEAESSISKASSEDEIRVLKSACLLGIGITGHRERTTLNLLELSQYEFNRLKDPQTKTIQNLIDKKLLLYRKNTDSVSIWHGTDVDLMGKLQEAKDRLALNFDSVDFLRSLIEAKHWKSVEYNNRFRINRYFRGEYLDFFGLEQLIDKGIEESLTYELKGNTYFEDGKIYYLIPKSDDEHGKMLEILVSESAIHPQVIFVLPRKTLDINEYALEVHAYIQMQDDPKLIESDPLILPELQQLSDDATDYLQRMVQLATEPMENGPLFFHKGKKVEDINDSKKLRQYLSIVMEKVFPYSPIMNNEMINRRVPRSNLVNSRKKLSLAILEQAGEKDFSMEGFTPNISFMRSLLLNTGLYSPVDTNHENKNWHFVQPNAIKDKGLQEVWQLFHDFFSDEKEYVGFETLYNQLKHPPYGLRDGILPILTASAMRAFPSALSITDKKNEYLPDILATDLESIMNKPYEYHITVKSLTESRIGYLNGIIAVFDPENKVSIREMDLIRRAYDAIELWKTKLTDASYYSRSISAQNKGFQELIRKHLEPSLFLLKSIPNRFVKKGEKNIEIETILLRLKDAKEEIESIPQMYYTTAKQALMSAIQLNSQGRTPALSSVKKWLEFFDMEVVKEINDGTCKSFINRVSNPYKEDKQLLDSLSSLIIGKDVMEWDDSDGLAFSKRVTEIVHNIEDFVMNSSDELDLNANVRDKLAHLALNRMASLRDKVYQLIDDEDKAQILINGFIGEDHGYHERSS